jgi:hypothetical protein
MHPLRRVANGALSNTDLRELLPTCWAYIDWPEEVIGAALWVPMFRAAGMLIVPTTGPRPDRPVDSVPRAPERRRMGMAWTLPRAKAVEYQVRYERRFETEPAHLYRFTVEPSDVLAVSTSAVTKRSSSIRQV